MAPPIIVILAAGQGTRMRSATPKMLHDLCGRPLVAWPVAAALEAGARHVIVVDGPERALAGHLPANVELAVQAQPRGTGDAVRAAAGLLGADDDVIVLTGDVPLISAEVIAALHAAHSAAAAAATIATMVLDDPSGYGRVVRDGAGDVERVVETKGAGDATAAQLAIREVNTGLLCFAAAPLRAALEQIEPANAQGEYYLPDVLPLLRAGGHRVGAFEVDDAALLLGVNDRAGLAAVRAEAQRRIQRRHMLAGVTIVQPSSTEIDHAVEIDAEAVIAPCTQLRGTTRIGAGAEVGPGTTVIDSVIGARARVLQSHLVSCEVGADVSVGPFSYLRPAARLGEGAKVGTFVEVKNSEIGAGAKVPHLSYIGDADVGEQSNLGAGTITANFDGRAKHRTRIGARVRGGVDVSYVAPVNVGDDAWTAAGSVVTEDVEAGALAVARTRQRNIDGYAERRSAAEAADPAGHGHAGRGSAAGAGDPAGAAAADERDDADSDASGA